MKKTLLVMVMAITLALSTMATAMAEPADMATGGLEYHSDATGADVKVAFNARGDAADAIGRVNVQGHEDWNTTTVADFKGDVTCYNQTGLNSATFTGEMTHFEGEGPEGYFRVTVSDGKDAGEPHQITVNRSDSEFDCTDSHTANNELNEGNLVVHHR